MLKMKMLTSLDLVLKKENISEQFLETYAKCIVSLDFHQGGNQT